MRSVLLALALLSLALSASAQGVDLSNNFNLTLSPELPGPEGEVRARVESFNTDLRKANIVWSLDGNIIAGGAGITQATFRTGKVGESKSLRVVISTAEGRRLERTLSIRPGVVTILWKADSSIPALFKGKALPAAEALIEAHAFTYLFDGSRRVPPEKLFYEWSLNFEPLPNQSGVGKKSVAVKGADFFGEATISVKVSTLDNKVGGKSLVQIRPASPATLLYKVDPLRGTLFDNALSSTLALDENEVTLEAGTFFFPATHKARPGLKYTWTMNGKAATVSEKTPDLITLRRGEGEGGEARIAVSVRDPFENLLSGARSLIIKFGVPTLE